MSLSSHSQPGAPPRPAGLTYYAGLDGLRALCVIAIMLYHADIPWTPGGFLGVESFFVISGFLITSLLHNEHAATARIDLWRFWQRRARRLLPALWALLAAVSAYAAARLPEELWRLRAEVLAALTYVTNWVLLLGEQSYFEEVGRPSLLRHLWSLAIEEQFYVVWPLLFAALAKRLGARLVGLVSVLLAACSIAWMASRFVPDTDPSALYYDSVARAGGLLLGAALALLWRPTARSAAASSGWLPDALGILGLSGLLAACTKLSEADGYIYRGGFVLIDLCTLAVIVSVTHPAARTFKQLLGSLPLRALGTRSYGLYLWHWPIFMLLRPRLDVPLGTWSALFLRLALSVVVAELSFRYIEHPVRSGRLGHAWRKLWTTGDARRKRVLAATWISALSACVAGCLVLTQAMVHARPPVEANWQTALRAESEQDLELAGVASDPHLIAEACAPDVSAGACDPVVSAEVNVENSEPVLDKEESADTPPMPLQAAGAAPPPVGHIKAPRVLTIGDSVMLGAARYLRAGGHDVEVDAQVGRSAIAAIQRLRERKQSGRLGRVIVIHLGNNGWFREHHVDEMMKLFDNAEHVVFVTNRVPRRWQDPNNAAIAAGVARHPRAVLVDWLALSEDHADWFRDDGLHLKAEGAKAYAELLRSHYSAAP